MGRVGTCRLHPAQSVGSERGGQRRGSRSGGLWGLDRCGCFRWWVNSGEGGGQVRGDWTDELVYMVSVGG